MRMPPMAVELLMRCCAFPAPNGEGACTPEHATSRAMVDWVTRFKRAGILEPDVTINNLIQGKLTMQYLTPAGEDLVNRICNTPFLPGELG